jgi:hypothetical protein
MYALFLAFAQIASPTVSTEVRPIHELEIEYCHIPLTLSSSPFTITCQNTYSITTNGDFKKIIGSLEHSLPSPLILTVALQAPKGAKSLGKVKLSTQEAVLVSHISRVAQENLKIIYTFSSSEPLISGLHPGQVRFTLVD